MKYLIFALLLALASCASTRVASSHHTDRDSTYVSTRYLDSLYRAVFLRDSTYRRDSIYIREKGDTITQYVERVMYKWRTRTDTLYRNRWRTDTLFVERVDSVYVEKPVYIDKQLKWHQQGFMWLGKMCCIAAILWAMFLYLKRKF
jgi:hypothetical protein